MVDSVQISHFVRESAKLRLIAMNKLHYTFLFW